MPENEERKAYCGYCGGNAVFSPENVQWQHADSGERVKADSPGDMISARHNREGSVILPVDIQWEDESDADPITDAAGYLSCGCLGTDRDHSCKAREVSEFNPASEI